MRRPLIAGNWKMNLNRAQSVALAREIAAGLNGSLSADVAVFPPAVYLDAVIAADTGLAVGAQDVNENADGAFTGEISCQMLCDLNVTTVILGHSERRNLLGETSEQVQRKTLAALRAGLTPIVCVGELLEQRQAGQTDQVVLEQCRTSLAGLSAEQMLQTVVAYEPVWAIGTGQVATPAQAEEVHASIRQWLSKSFSPATAAQVRILYGGSVKADNAAELLSQANIDGALVGGASLKAESFLGIIRATETQKVA
ncbi:MAG: triose-phosphate isomerase [Pirellulaceae bacterium]|nr:triose-phosphate isomerase [Pirellulaceae bacterium]